jgi:hypothetical protein
VDTTCLVSNELLERITLNHSYLLLDNRNPRFYGEELNKDYIRELNVSDPRLQEYLRQTIYNKYNVQDLVSSIVEIGFLRLDPIIVAPEGDYYRVVEGNRRLSAIKTIHGDIRRKTLSVSDDVYKSITEIEVVNLKEGYDESLVWMLQGIRHVSGIRDWGPFQQAELIKTLYNSRGMTYQQIGAVIGLSPARVSTILKAYCGVIQMMEHEKWSQYATPNLFSHFEQAYVRAPIRDWLGWDKDASKFMNSEGLELFYNWIVNDDPSIPREKLKSRDIRDKLPLVLENEEARELMLSDEVSIDEAYSSLPNKNKEKKKLEKITDDLKSYLIDIKHSHKLSQKEKKALIELKNQIIELL